jgi:hypothetical protein
MAIINPPSYLLLSVMLLTIAAVTPVKQSAAALVTFLAMTMCHFL